MNNINGAFFRLWPLNKKDQKLFLNKFNNLEMEKKTIIIKNCSSVVIYNNTSSAGGKFKLVLV